MPGLTCILRPYELLSDYSRKMSQSQKLQKQAVVAAKQQDWDEAVRINQEILDLRPLDVNALNRLGAAYLQLKNPRKAKDIFSQVMKIDRNNKLAQKHLERIKSKNEKNLPSFSQKSFIEEPGKTKSVDLYRLAGKEILENLNVGQEGELEPKNRYISINVDGTYIGSLPEDLSFRLTKLMDSGNAYSCLVQSCDKNHCTVFLKEEVRSDKNQDINSFPKNHKENVSTVAVINEVDESMLEDDIPVEIVSTDTDAEKSLDDIEAPEEE